MTAPSVDALLVLLDQLVAQRDRTLAQLRRHEDVARRQQAQLEQIEGYRRDYAGRWTAQFSQGGSAVEIVHCYHSFMARLDDASGQQVRNVDAARSACERARQELMALEMRVAAVRKLIERRRAESARHAARREQRATDDAALQALSRSGTEATPMTSR